jgi:hypothetical protein
MQSHDGLFKGLSEQQIVAFETLKSRCAEAGLLVRPPALSSAEVEDGLIDDPTLLSVDGLIKGFLSIATLTLSRRFLRARRYDVQGALKQFKEARRTWETNNVSQLYNEIEIESFEIARPFVCCASPGRRSKAGRPIFLFDFAYFNQAVLASYEQKSRGSISSNQASVQQREASKALVSVTRFVLPLCSAMKDRPDPASPITSGVFVVDLTVFTLKGWWGVKNYKQDISGLVATEIPRDFSPGFCMLSPCFLACHGVNSPGSE